MAAIGSPAWIAKTNGALGFRDQLRFTAQAILRELGQGERKGRPVAVARSAGSSSTSRSLVGERVWLVGSVARQVAGFVQGVLPGPLLQHSVRSWLWACLLGEVEQISYDEECLYVAALLHDVALVDGYRPGPEAACFAVHGADVARGVVIGAGAGDAFADVVADAIAAHFNVAVPLAWGAEAYLLHAGTHADVVGRRLVEIAPSTVAEVLAEAPRAGFTEHFLAVMREEAELRRSSRAGLLWRLGMERSVRRAEGWIG
jgi:hypothetical protein